MFKLQRWLIFAIAFLCFAQVTIDPTTLDMAEWLNGSSAEAKSRGGSSSSRSSSSSSKSSSSSSKSSSSSSSPSKSSNTGNTGGRARGGSFDRKVSPQENRQPSSAPTSPSTKTPTPPSYPSNYPSRQYTPSRPIYINPEIEIEIEDDDDDKPYPYTQPVPAPYIPGGTPVQPVPSNNSAAPIQNTAPNSTTAPYSTPQTETEKDGFPWKFLFFLLVVGGGLFFAWYLLSKRGGKSSGTSSELSNDTVTVTKLQIALLAEARDIQSQLSDLSLQADLDTPEGLSEFLQETALSVLRNPQYWSHGQSSSQAVASRDEAGRMFEKLSIAERRKFGVETLSRTNGHVRSKSVEIDPDIEPAEYIVVTLLVGTEDDRPLFDPIHSAEDLKQALETLAAIPPNALSIFELLWSPQTSTDSLSYDELLTEYTELLPLG